MKKIVVLFTLALLLLSANASAFNRVISNSEDWKDVYSTILFANLKGATGDFLTSTRHGPILINEISSDSDILLVTSRSSPYVLNYPDLIRAKKFTVEEREVNSANIELINDAPEITNFVVVGDYYGYNAIAVTPYAEKTKSWVFLANKANAYQIDSIMSKRNVQKVLLYGYLDKEVKDALSKYTPEVINTGDRFKDNVEIVKKYLAITPVKQVALTNGEFIEKEVMEGLEPVLFTGKQDVPEAIREYLKTSGIEVGVLIGNDLVGAATTIRRNTGISVMVKFARGARGQTGGISAVEGLDLYPIPVPALNLTIHSIKYNKVNSKLQVTYKSNSNVPAYYKGTITLRINGASKRLGDYESIFIAPGDYKTESYDLEGSPDTLEADVFTLYGETPTSLDRILEGRYKIEGIEVLDKCEIDVKSVKYNKEKKSFTIKIINKGETDCWADTEIKDLVINSEKRTIAAEKTVRIPVGKTRNSFIEFEMTQEDLENNQFVNLVVYYGEREDALVNKFTGKFELGIEKENLMMYAIIIVIIVILLILIILFFLRRREKEEDEY